MLGAVATISRNWSRDGATCPPYIMPYTTARSRALVLASGDPVDNKKREKPAVISSTSGAPDLKE
jgi:hypothetical protein